MELNSIVNYAEVAFIIVLCYAIGFICKQSEKIRDNYIPIIVVCCGAIFGALGYFIIKDFPYTDILNSIACGAFNGFIAVGINQLGKQLTKEK